MFKITAGNVHKRNDFIGSSPPSGKASFDLMFIMRFRACVWRTVMNSELSLFDGLPPKTRKPILLCNYWKERKNGLIPPQRVLLRNKPNQNLKSGLSILPSVPIIVKTVKSLGNYTAFILNVLYLFVYSIEDVIVLNVLCRL